MKVRINGEQVTVEQDNGKSETFPIGTPEAFSVLSKVWLRSGWDIKHVYSFTWLGRPIIQLPEDLLRLQEVIYSVRPDVIVETGVAHGGGLVFYASLCKAMNRGYVIGVDIEIRPQNRNAIEAHELSSLITLIEGSSTDPTVIQEVQDQIKPSKTVLVFLDAKHTKEHVLAELNAYAPMINVGSYIVAMDGIMGDLSGAPRTHPDWSWDNPKEAAKEFVKNNPNYVIEEPKFQFNEGTLKDRVTYWPSGFIKRIS